MCSCHKRQAATSPLHSSRNFSSMEKRTGRFVSVYIQSKIFEATSPSWLIFGVWFRCFKLQKPCHSVLNKRTQCSPEPKKNYVHVLSSLYEPFLRPISASPDKHQRRVSTSTRKVAKSQKGGNIIKGVKNLTSFTRILIVDRLWCGSELLVVARINRFQIDRQYHAETG